MKKNEMIVEIKKNYPALKDNFYNLLNNAMKHYTNGANIELIYTKPMKAENKPYEIYTMRKGRWIVDVKPYRAQINVSLMASDVKKVIFEIHVGKNNKCNMCTRGTYLNKLERSDFIVEGENGATMDLYDMIKDGITYHAKWDMRFKLEFGDVVLNKIVSSYSKLVNFNNDNGLIDLFNYPDGNKKMEVTKKEYEDAKPEIIEEEGEGEE